MIGVENREKASDLSLGYADIPDPMVKEAIAAIIARMTPHYFELMKEAKADPTIISDFQSSLAGYENFGSLRPQMRAEIKEAQRLAPNCKIAIKISTHDDSRVSVFSETNSELNTDQTIDQTRLHIRCRVEAKDIQERDALDRLLSQLFKKLKSLGCGDKGRFDIRLEKGILALEGGSWRWHHDGEIFKTSITTCYSKKKEWSTRISTGPTEHGVLYDAKKVFHRAPLSSDLNGEELKLDDYRLFIRYNEFYAPDETTFQATKEEDPLVRTFTVPVPSSFPPLTLPEMKKINVKLPGFEKSEEFKHLFNSQWAIPKIIPANFENLLTPIVLPKINVSELLANLLKPKEP